MTQVQTNAVSRPRRVLIVKLSSLGDVIHTLPVVADIQKAWPDAQIDWVVERGIASLVKRCKAVSRVIEIDLRRWHKHPFAAETRVQWRAFKASLQQQRYDVVLDLQGITKSALVSWLTHLAPGGQRIAIGNRTQDSGYEFPTRWPADRAIKVPLRTHAMTRGRYVAGQALGYTPDERPDFGLGRAQADALSRVVLVHATSRADKEWPRAHWIELGQRLQQAGFAIVLPHGSDSEEQFAHELAASLPGAQVWPRLSLDALTTEMAQCTGVIGVDSGLSHLAVALDLPHVQLYNFETAWRTGPQGVPYQCAVFDRAAPSVDAVWQAWQQVLSARAGT